MSKGTGKVWDVCVPVETTQGDGSTKTHWHKIGKAWEQYHYSKLTNTNGKRIWINLNSLPMTRDVYLYESHEDTNAQTPQGTKGSVPIT